jgi:FkbM family methyltransferase
MVRERLAFVRREATKQPVVGSYTLARHSDAVVCLRHDGLDAWTLEEIFGMAVYGMPQPVRDTLVGLDRPPRILDLGANIGLTVLFFSQALPTCTGIAVEPDPQNAALLKKCLLANHLGARWEVVEACAGTEDGTTSFVYGQSTVGRAVSQAGTGTIQVAVRDVLPELARADLAKLDIEGAEWQLVCDSRFRESSPTALVVEYHADDCPGVDPRAVMIDLLNGAGYETLDVAFPPRARLPAGQGVLWAWRMAHAGHGGLG